MRFVVSILMSLPAQAPQGLVPGPGQPGSNAALHQLAAQYDRQFHVFNAVQFGLSLDAFIPDPNDRALVEAFLAQTAEPDFLAFTTAAGTPRSAEDVIASYDEHGDLGMFGGLPAAAEAFRYALLRDGGAPAADVAAARADLLDAIDAFHVYAAITGEPGTIARGIRRTSEAGPPPEPLPSTCAAAWDRTSNVWRSDQSGAHPDWYWNDNTSKDQMIGYTFALGAFWDVIATDPSIAQSIKDQLQADAVAMGRSLMQPVEVKPGSTIDLVIRDAAGCLTRFHDLNPREIPLDGNPPLVLDETSNARIGFNAIAALGIIRTLYHVSGDEQLRSYYYDELINTRGYTTAVMTGAARLRNMFANTCIAGNCVVTNFSNVNMAFVSIYGVLRYEPDPNLRTAYRTILEGDLWDGPRPHMGIVLQQAFFDLLWAGFRTGASDDAQADEAAASLLEWPAPPYWNGAVENCDAGEIAAGSCVGIDGTTNLTLDDVPARGGGLAAEVALPKRIRIPSDFEWRSDPRLVNGGGGDRLNPGGDFRSAYWMGRFLQRGSDTAVNVSPIARNPDGTGGPPLPGTDAGVADSSLADADVDAGTDAESDAGIDPTMDAATDDAAESSDAAADDAAETPDKDASQVDTAVAESPDAGSNTPAPESGCNCSAGERGRSANPAWWLAALVPLLHRRRRDPKLQLR